MSLLFSICVVSLCEAQNTQSPAAPAAPATPPPAPPRSAQPPAPDYPDPRTLTFGVFYMASFGSTAGPDLTGGVQALGYETLDGLGKPKTAVPGIEVSMPITRTGTLHFESMLAKGDGTQNTPAQTDVFGVTYAQGDTLTTQYQFFASKFYLDDLLFPHKFPVAKFRLKSLWEFQYIHMKSTTDSQALDAIEGPGSGTAVGTKQIFLPTFGIAAEYALSPHVLLRGDISGFGIPHHSNIWDAGATLSYRHGSWEGLFGAKVLHFKTSPQAEEYLTDTLSGAYVGLRWHWSL